MTKPAKGFYNTTEWHKLRAKVKKRWKAEGLPCGFCGLPIDWSKRPVVDHIQNRKHHPHLAHDESNLQCVHHTCNTRKAHWVERTSKQAIGLDGWPIED